MGYERIAMLLGDFAILVPVAVVEARLLCHRGFLGLMNEHYCKPNSRAGVRKRRRREIIEERHGRSRRPRSDNEENERKFGGACGVAGAGVRCDNLSPRAAGTYVHSRGLESSSGVDIPVHVTRHSAKILGDDAKIIGEKVAELCSTLGNFVVGEVERCVGGVSLRFVMRPETARRG